jgi:hypothetical protein
MDRAINKSTDKIVTAIEVFENGSYQNLTKGEWIAPKEKIENWDEITEEDKYVHYVKEKKFTNFKGTVIWCSPCFSVYPGSIAITTIPDPTHKMLENWLFGRLQEDDIEIVFATGIKPNKYTNKFKLSELKNNINWNDYKIEVTTKGTKKLRADILLPFNNKHQLLGEGIIFEIQLSNQSDSITFDRTISRALHGYSTCWLFENDFVIEEDNIKLNNSSLKINSFSEQMHFAKKGFVGKLKQTVEEQCRFLDKKIGETNDNIESLEDKKTEIIKGIDSHIDTKINDINTQLKVIISNQDKLMNEKQELIIQSIKKIEENPFNSIIESYKIELQKEFKLKEAQIKEVYSTLLDNLIKQNATLKSNFEYWKNEMNNPEVIGVCQFCKSGTMVLKKGKFGDFYGCSNYPNCKNIIKRGSYDKTV